MTRDAGDKSGLILAAVICVALCVVAYMLPGGGATAISGNGVCLPSPTTWNISPVLSWILNIATIGISALLLLDTNRRYNFIPSPTVIYASTFLIMTGAAIWPDQRLNSSVLLGLANVVALRLLLSRYGRDTAPMQLFIIGTIFAIGSMFHYAFIFFILIYALSALTLKLFGWRELGALILGVAAPYWILLGSGIIPMTALHIPSVNGIWMADIPAPEMIWLILLTGLTALWGLLITCHNVMALYSAGNATRAMAHCIILPAIAVLILILIDYANFMVYYVSLILFTAIEAGYFVAFGDRHSKAIIYWTVLAGYVTFSILYITNGI